jgi:hypothetical protein
MNSPQSIDRIASPEANWGQIERYQDIKKRGASQAVAKLDFATHHPLPMTGPGGSLFHSQWKDGFGAESDPCRGDGCRHALRPTATSRARSAMAGLRRLQPVGVIGFSMQNPSPPPYATFPGITPIREALRAERP